MHGPVPNGNYAYGISGNNTVGLYYWNAPVNGVNGYSGFSLQWQHLYDLV